ncbi:hypothetical protein L1887_34261 [Cichorium endivia]|nr:hypothetical protein L1887_34261 [Cichorium endivia]
MASSSSSVVIWDFLDFNPFIMKGRKIDKPVMITFSNLIFFPVTCSTQGDYRAVTELSYVSSKQKIELPRDFVLKFEPKHVMKNLITKGNSARGFVSTSMGNYNNGAYIDKNKSQQDVKEYNQESPKGRRRNFRERRMGACVVGCLGKVALIKAKSFDEKHQFTSNASAKAVYLDSEQKTQTTTTAIMINAYMSSGVVWVSGAFAAITKAVEVFHMDAFG